MDLVTRQREERKRRILEVARGLIGDRGYEGVTMRDLAEASLVSVPTLYNLFGGKNELLLQAVLSHFGTLIGSAERPGPGVGLDRVLSLVETIGRETPQHATYARALMSFFGGASDRGNLHDFVSNALSSELIAALEEMQEKRQLLAWADPRALGERLASQLTITTFEWSYDRLSDEGFLDAMLYGTGVMLLGFARGKAAVEVERLVSKHQSAAVARPSSESLPDPLATGTEDKP
ncbi:MAG: TetR/AcrR family transcriptional regulator [Deltaproteobacteria bacterium]|nr:TetR/AcrR family transcriptional regulator [Deltaproteobacteria bacterium]MBW2445804.1 TetR/AcrR family transcriptional regulator [Deltaproteobacteria bacterium]